MTFGMEYLIYLDMNTTGSTHTNRATTSGIYGGQPSTRCSLSHPVYTIANSKSHLATGDNRQTHLGSGIDPAQDITYERTGPSSWGIWQRQTSQGLIIARYHLPTTPIHTAGWPTTLTRILVTLAHNLRYVYFHNAGNSDFQPTTVPII